MHLACSVSSSGHHIPRRATTGHRCGLCQDGARRVSVSLALRGVFCIEAEALTGARGAGDSTAAGDLGCAVGVQNFT